jgi:4-carboxymuconolactone decarboxylase
VRGRGPGSQTTSSDELLFQIAAYCGAPAGVSARRSLLAVRADEQNED